MTESVRPVPHWLSRLAMGTFALSILAILFGDLSTWLELGLLRDISAGILDDTTLNARADANDLRQVLATLANGIAVLVCGLVFLGFTARAYIGAKSLGQPMKYNTFWSVGFFFVPVLHLWMPILVLKHIWERSSVRALRGIALILSGWWALVWLSGLGKVIKATLQIDTVEDYVLADRMVLWFSLADLLASILGLFIVWAIARAQREHAEAFTTRAAS